MQKITNVESITDIYGDTVTINKNGVHHSDGKSIAFDRDGQGRITKITGQTDKSVSYSYDAVGDLVSIIDIA